MLSFSDMPYAFVPPKPSPAVIWSLRQVNRLLLKTKRHQIRSLDVVGGDAVRQLQDDGAKLLFLVNHSTHSDVEAISEAYRRIGVRTHFMAAYDVFLRSKFKGWMMQCGGAFSVDREGSDKQSMKQAITTLSEGDYGLTIFPEGNVYFTNERVTPFLEGAAFMALQAQKSLAEDRALCIVPVAIRMTHVEDRRDYVRTRLEELAAHVNDRHDREANIVDELTRLGLELLRNRLRELGHNVPDGNADLATTLDTAAGGILSRIEEAMSIRVRDESDLAAKIAEEWADDAMLALRVLSYLTDYVRSNPTLDRVAETVEKLCEDLHDELQLPFGPRHAWVSFGEALNVADYMESKTRVAAAKLTDAVAEAVQGMLDKRSAENPHPGGNAF
jgi:1-acyl-sn-glycerol-3-phosphate acyltransferase